MLALYRSRAPGRGARRLPGHAGGRSSTSSGSSRAPRCGSSSRRSLRQDATLGGLARAPPEDHQAARGAAQDGDRFCSRTCPAISSGPGAARGCDRAAWSRIRDGLESHGATIEQRAGDEVMAVFGVPDSNEDDALRAARAALEVRSRDRGSTDVLEQAGRGRIDLRVGDRRRARYSPGPTLRGTASSPGLPSGWQSGSNRRALPARSWSATEALGLLGDTVETEPFQGARPGDRRVLGIVEGAPALARHLEVALVGREHELAALRAAFERVAGEGALPSVHDHRGGRDRKNATRGRADLERSGRKRPRSSAAAPRTGRVRAICRWRR